MPLAAIHDPIIAYTSEDDRLADVRERGERLARERGATLILYDIDAAQPLEGSPLPTNWSAEGPDRGVPDRLSPQDLEKAGRAAIARQVSTARERGIDAWGWLPAKPAAEALSEYAQRVGAGTVLLPAELEAPGLIDRLRGRTVHAEDVETPPDVDVEVVRG
jgi:hypothetical protein